METTSEKITTYIKSNLLDFIVVITAFAYVFYNQIVLNTGVEIAESTATVLIGIICGLVIKQSLGESGISKGFSSPLWLESKEKYNKARNMATPYIDKIDNFYIKEEADKKKEYRIVVLRSYAMRYSWFFDNKGNYTENKEQYEKLDKKQKRILAKCIKVKIYTLNLFSEYSLEVTEYTKKETTDKSQRAKMLSRNIFMQVAVAFVGGYFTASFGGWSWGKFIISLLQVCVWIGTGIMQLYSNYNYVVVDKVNKLSRKVELITKFTKGAEQGLYDTNPYEDIETQDAAQTPVITEISRANGELERCNNENTENIGEENGNEQIVYN